MAAGSTRSLKLMEKNMTVTLPRNVLRLDAAELGQASLVEKMLRWCKEQLERRAA